MGGDARKDDPGALVPRRTSSLAWRLAVWYANIAFAILLMASVAYQWILTDALERDDDDFLLDRVREIRLLLERQPFSAIAIQERVEREAFVSRSEPVYLRISDQAGYDVWSTPGLGERLHSANLPSVPGTTDLTSIDGRPFRVVCDVLSADRRTWTIHAVLDRDRDEDVLMDFRSRAALVLFTALPVTILAAWVIARLGIAPVRAIAATAARIRSTHLGERIRLDRFPAELVHLGASFNAMLDRLEQAFNQISRFSADIAHELRTPLTNLRGTAEVALSRTRTTEEYQEVLGSCLEETARLTRIVDSLLFLARAEADRVRPTLEKLDVAGELEGVRDYLALQAEEKGIRLSLECPAGLEARLDRTLFQRAVGNLVQNALAHTPRGGSVSVQARAREGRVEVEVGDTGPGIAAEHLPRIFERFYRADTSRTSLGGGVGLGLAIVRGIAELHGGGASVTSTVGKGSRFTVTFPAEPKEPSGT
ncbi:MAG: heavy metal sensor histidine kinase [Candidatus Brocadiae bacterium]|nr:heavy metal sensor histidine kinase [Candidatus Brocadiia bacterium]